MKRSLLMLALLLLIPGGQACSLAYQEFETADLAGNKVLTTIGQDGVVIDLATGKQTTVTQDFFPRLKFAGTNYILHSGQEGLGGDCSGRRYFEAVTLSGSQLHERGDVLAFDADGSKYAWVTIQGTYVGVIGQWSQSTRVSTGVSEDVYVDVALDAAAGRLAITRGDGSVDVYDIASGNRLATLDGFGDDQWQSALEWHDGRLVVARADADEANFWVIDLDSGTRRVFTIDDDAWSRPAIASGAVLLLHYGETMLRVTDSGSQKLKGPSTYSIGAVGGDAGGAVILVQKAGDFGENGVGILRVQQDGTLGSWYAKSGADWKPATRPAFSWQAGPSPAVEHEEPTIEESPAVPLVGAFLAIVGVALLRRRTG